MLVWRERSSEASSGVGQHAQAQRRLVGAEGHWLVGSKKEAAELTRFPFFFCTSCDFHITALTRDAIIRISIGGQSSAGM